MGTARRLASYRSGSGVDPWIDRVIADRYRMLEPLGAGSVGRVYRAEDLAEGRVVAVKVIGPRPPVEEDPQWLRRVEALAAAVASLEHPNIARLLDFGLADESSFFVAMEYLEGRTLEELLVADAPLGFTRQLRIGRQLARAIASAHAHGLVHRDLKPSNVMVLAGEEEQVKLLDFGIAGQPGDAPEDPAAGPQGSPTYMAPGQARGDGPDPRDDVYSLGVILYEMACGRPPFEADSAIAVILMHVEALPKAPRMIDREVPPLLEAAILRALAKNRLDRFQTMDEWIEALEAAEAQLEEAGRFAGDASTLGRSRLHRSFVAVGALTGALFLLYVGLRALT